MYILIVSRGYPTEKYKMNGIFEFDQAKALAESGHKVIIAAIDLRSFRRKRKWGLESLKQDGVQIEVINVPGGRIPKLLSNRLSRFALKKLYKRIENQYGKPDLIHAHFIKCGYITAKLFKDSKIPLVITEHYSGMNQVKIDDYLVKLGEYTYSTMGKVIAVSNCLANNLRRNFNVDPIVIPNIVDTKSFNYRIEEKVNSNFSFVCTGSLTKNKGMDILISAFNKVFKNNKNVNLYIFGNGPERPYLERMIQEIKLVDQIFLMGLVDRAEIANKMAESQCFVLASRLETFGVAYIEAMAMGLPVISTKCGGPEDFINNSNGILVEIDNICELAIAMKKIYININSYDRKFISNSIKDRFGSQTISYKLLDVYEDLINKARKVDNDEENSLL